MNSVKYLNISDDPDENQQNLMVRKLPWYLINRWSREVDCRFNKDGDQRHDEVSQLEVTESESGYPPFSVFCRFLQS